MKNLDAYYNESEDKMDAMRDALVRLRKHREILLTFAKKFGAMADDIAITKYGKCEGQEKDAYSIERHRFLELVNDAAEAIKQTKMERNDETR